MYCKQHHELFIDPYSVCLDNNRDFLPGATAQRSMEPTVHSSGSSAQFEDAEWQTEWDDPEDPEWTHTIGQNATECYPYCDS